MRRNRRRRLRRIIANGVMVREPGHESQSTHPNRGARRAAAALRLRAGLSHHPNARRGWPSAAIVGIVALMLFAAIAWSVFGSDVVPAWDREALTWIRDHTEAPLLHILTIVSNGHRPRLIMAATALALAWLLWRRERAQALFLLGAVVGGAALNHWVKHATQRLRPGDAGLSVAATDFSFPSGHVANSTLLYGALALLVAGRTQSRALQVAAWVLATLAVALVAGARLVLGAHHPSDVAAGAVLAIGWLALCLTALQGWQGRDADG
jgi:undecaprenyl-diphosphatase